MLDLRRLRLLRELAARGTIGAVAAGARLQPVRGLPAARAAREGGGRAAARARRAQRAADGGGADARRPHRRAARPRGGGRGRPRRRPPSRSPARCGWRRSSRPACTCSRPRCAGCRAEHPALRVEVTDAEPETSLPSARARHARHRARRPVPVPPAPAGRRGWTSSRCWRSSSASCCRPSTRWPASGGPVALAALRDEPWAIGKDDSALRRADDPRLPGARRLRARRPPPLQRPADAARAGRQRAGRDAAARPRARRTASRPSSPATSPRRR